jgi:flagellin-like protein
MRINRSISPVISVILLVAIAIGAAAAFYAWVGGVQTPVQERGSEIASRAVLSASGEINIESVDINTSGTSYVYFRNLGSVYLSNFSLYINDAYDSKGDFGLDKGELANMSTTAITTPGETYVVKIIARQGGSGSIVKIAD